MPHINRHRVNFSPFLLVAVITLLAGFPVHCVATSAAEPSTRSARPTARDAASLLAASTSTRLTTRPPSALQGLPPGTCEAAESVLTMTVLSVASDDDRTQIRQFRDGVGNTFLHLAGLCDAPPDVVEWFITEGLSARSRNTDGKTPLHAAAEGSSHPAVIAMLIDAGAPIEALDDGSFNLGQWREARQWDTGYFPTGPRGTPLLRAARHNPHVSVLRALLSSGADIEAREMPGRSQANGGQTPLIVAAASNSVAVVNALLAAGADVHADTHVPKSATANRSAPTIRVGPTAERELGPTALHAAASSNPDPKVVAALVAAGADVAARTGRRVGVRVAGREVKCYYEGDQEMPTRTGDTPLHFAANASRNPDVLEALLSAGAKMNPASCGRYSVLGYLERNSALRESDIYWRIRDAHYQP